MLWLKRTGLVLVVLSLSACATTAAPPAEDRNPGDPWEPANRQVHAFNMAADRAVLRPVARGYQRVAPQPVRTGVRNFFTNLRSPVVIVNLLLQGRPGESLEHFERFFVNSVYGLGGIFDLASKGEMPAHEADLGMTFAVWGWDESRFVMLPFLGPSTLRDGLGFYGDSFINPVWELARGEGAFGLLGLNIIQTRAALLPLDPQIDAAFDSYIFLRDGFLQRRQFQLQGQDAALPDYDDFLDDWDDWDD
ncbi:MAG: MlaA family lipoprotein [Wenzhouxiangella sp.]